MLNSVYNESRPVVHNGHPWGAIILVLMIMVELVKLQLIVFSIRTLPFVMETCTVIGVNCFCSDPVTTHMICALQLTIRLAHIYCHLDLSMCPLLHKSLQPPCIMNLQGSDIT